MNVKLIVSVIVVLMLMIVLAGAVNLLRERGMGATNLFEPRCGEYTRSDFTDDLKSLLASDAIRASQLYYQTVELHERPCPGFAPDKLVLTLNQKRAIFCTETFDDTKLSAVLRFRQENCQFLG